MFRPLAEDAMPSSRLTLVALLAACLLAGCDSSSRSWPATGLSYTDPTGSGWRLVRDPGSTATRLVLNLVGPADLKTRGAGFNLVAPDGVHFLRFDSTGFPVEPGAVYELLNTQPFGAPDPLEPRLVAGAVKPGNLLTVAVFQKDRRASAKLSGAPLFRIALELDPTTGAGRGSSLALQVVKARYMAEDIGAFNVNPTVEMSQKSKLQDMTIAVGALHAN
jgi:hypothetical protein